ncbi:hypothetical protein AVEN_20482-1 [Araneus ventricosus]|uniref:Uncharacterized protein n=1 Tax=Araneus ventricosus TaxID=182803 RepID=A0A4Y2RW79_ARAVE|nr:hypothetical protein AVEN_20482-1 [Araneus ventricosus]
MRRIVHFFFIYEERFLPSANIRTEISSFSMDGYYGSATECCATNEESESKLTESPEERDATIFIWFLLHGLRGLKRFLGKIPGGL